ncbi:SDR family oxidoreductase [Peptostreptococcus faecalis]|uniref:SDR family oxidoreductase n=1 Tax=Peptostreptococcus faecalis TaxID=2045015 RepID=UPI000C7C9E95|nr:SDR family NAD(P)-dependent oxidoreductase [Peptostreptococcus faecalis]
MKLKNKVAIVTGASSGMGAAIALEYAKEGAKVYAMARRVERLEELKNKAKDFQGEIIPTAIDLMDLEQIPKNIKAVKEKENRLDILVNNAGIMDDFAAVGDFNDGALEKIFTLNTYVPFYTSREAIRIFEEQGSGNIINVASVGGLNGARGGSIYTASKHAVIGLTKNTGYIYAKSNIRCNAICPGGVATEIGEGEYMQDVNEKAREVILPATRATNPRFGASEEIAKIALFLASDDSSFINGQSIVADGGWTAY